MKHYAPEIEAEIRAFYYSLSEKDRRRYAAIEARKLGYGGQTYMASLLGCDRHTIALGLAELKDPDALAQSRIRQFGAGRKHSLDSIAYLEANFLEVLENYTAGSPTNSALKWTNLTQREIAQRLKERGIEISLPVVKQLLDKHHYVRRKAQKRQSVGQVACRDQQFVKIAQLKANYAQTANPILSVDTKKKK